MKASLLACTAALCAVSAAEDAYLWTIDHGAPKHFNTQASSISSHTASSILVRRRGLNSQRHLGAIDDGELLDINKYGGHQTPLFDVEETETPVKLLIRISGYQGDLWIEQPALDLQDDFGAREKTDGVCEYNVPVPNKRGVDIVYSYNPKDSGCSPLKEVKNLPILLTACSAVPTADSAASSMGSFLRMLSHLAVADNVESTLVVLPPRSKLVRSQASRRNAVTEQPLEFASTSSSTPTLKFTAANTSRPLPSVIPQCFSTNDTCRDATNSCSGHGKCERARENCFKCTCGTTTIREGKTVQWGGNACQKKDVSVPFMLFAGMGVIMFTLIAGAIGMLYSMGAEELPSVIGAGVTGPKAQK